MKIKFKEQKFQLDAVQSVVDCFKGQVREFSKFTLDRGRVKGDLEGQTSLAYEEGFKNKPIVLFENDIFKNIKEIQLQNSLKSSHKLEGKYNLTIEMETGTGKTYTYIRTMY
ncbi:MAG: DEAD/DEAH box helicase family protein, partial [Alkaliphilus sp.]|nr:DEAD/DEAH box helicase family protein [Alkaliphilus sp.]